jgi:hypothetical protein
MEVSRQAASPRSSGMAENPEDTTAPAAADRVRSKERTNDSTIKDVKAVDKRSLDYVLRSGLAGGLAGCAVGSIRLYFGLIKILIHTVISRPKLSLLPLIESKSSSKHRIHSLRNILEVGPVWPWLCATYINTRVLGAFTKDIRQPYYEYSHTLPSSSLHMNKFERSSFHPEKKRHRFAV